MKRLATVESVLKLATRAGCSEATKKEIKGFFSCSETPLWMARILRKNWTRAMELTKGILLADMKVKLLADDTSEAAAKKMGELKKEAKDIRWDINYFLSVTGIMDVDKTFDTYWYSGNIGSIRWEAWWHCQVAIIDYFEVFVGNVIRDKKGDDAWWNWKSKQWWKAAEELEEEGYTGFDVEDHIARDRANGEPVSMTYEFYI